MANQSSPRARSYCRIHLLSIEVAHLELLLSTEPEKMACTWFGEIPSCCSLTALLGPVWVLLNYVLQTIFSGPVFCIRLGGYLIIILFEMATLVVSFF